MQFLEKCVREEVRLLVYELFKMTVRVWCAYAHVSGCVCVCAKERERERKRDRKRMGVRNGWGKSCVYDMQHSILCSTKKYPSF